MKPKISIIIPTVNAVDELDLALTSLEQNSDTELEIIVVVDPDQKTLKTSKAILSVCKKHALTPLINKANLGPYGSWNRGAKAANSDYLVFATDDQYYAPHWDSNLLKYIKPLRLVAGRLVEPGVIPVYKDNIQQDFGTTPSEFKEADFISWCQDQKAIGFVPGGFFIPMLQNKADFIALGGFKAQEKFGTSSAVSNDYLFIENAQQQGYEFGTAADSYSYHFQASSWKKKTLTPSIAAVVLTHNSEKYLADCLTSLAFTSQIVVVDGGSTDATLSIAKKHQALVLSHAFESFALQRNFAISQSLAYDWVLMIDADEEVSPALASELKSFAKDIYLDGVMVPRKNYIFGKWIEHADWYPDHRLVFFRPKLVQYEVDVHETAHFIKGNGALSTAKSDIIHHNYESVEQFVTKNLVRYPREYAAVLHARGVRFSASEMISKSIGEFLRRFFLTKGYQDGMYGLLLSLLMGAQNLVAYIYLWELQGYHADLTELETKSILRELKKKGGELSYWLTTLAIESSHGAAKFLHRAKRKGLKFIRGL
jgi:glycosyltransferase involved in cell wall biosynthesis